MHFEREFLFQIAGVVTRRIFLDCDGNIFIWQIDFLTFNKSMTNICHLVIYVDQPIPWGVVGLYVYSDQAKFEVVAFISEDMKLGGGLQLIIR